MVFGYKHWKLWLPVALTGRRSSFISREKNRKVKSKAVQTGPPTQRSDPVPRPLFSVCHPFVLVICLWRLVTHIFHLIRIKKDEIGKWDYHMGKINAFPTITSRLYWQNILLECHWPDLCHMVTLTTREARKLRDFFPFIVTFCHSK